MEVLALRHKDTEISISVLLLRDSVPLCGLITYAKEAVEA
jgi:hypothetical protein